MIETSGLSYDSAARAMGISRPILARKVTATDKSISFGDVLDLIDGCPDAGEALVRRLQERVDLRRGVRCPAPEMLPRICLYVVHEVGKVCLEIGVCVGQSDGPRLLELCAVVHAQVARLESCLRGLERSGT